MVIDDHVSTRIGVLSSIFPYNSFYMPLFVFISGYFYKERSIYLNIKHKFKHLMVPYVIWSIFGDFIAYILMQTGIVNWYVSPFNIRSIINLFTYTPLSTITGAAWFVVMLFWVSVIYNVLRHSLYLESKKLEYIFLAVSVISGFICIKLCMLGYNKKSLFLFIFRTVWYLQFYHMGVMFHKYWEIYVQKARLLTVCSLCVAINVVFILTTGNIQFTATAHMNNFHSYWIPLITSITGSMFWYKIMALLSSKIGKICIVDFLAENTFSIMCVHLIFLNLPNFYAYYQYIKKTPNYLNFPVSAFKAGAWVRYSPDTRLIGFFCGLLGSLLVVFLIHKIEFYLATRKRTPQRSEIVIGTEE